MKRNAPVFFALLTGSMFAACKAEHWAAIGGAPDIVPVDVALVPTPLTGQEFFVAAVLENRGAHAPMEGPYTVLMSVTQFPPPSGGQHVSGNGQKVISTSIAAGQRATTEPIAGPFHYYPDAEYEVLIEFDPLQELANEPVKDNNRFHWKGKGSDLRL